jgi:hypothetical protein
MNLHNYFVCFCKFIHICKYIQIFIYVYLYYIIHMLYMNKYEQALIAQKYHLHFYFVMNIDIDMLQIKQ